MKKKKKETKNHSPRKKQYCHKVGGQHSPHPGSSWAQLGCSGGQPMRDAGLGNLTRREGSQGIIMEREK